MNVIFMGTSDFAIPALEKLALSSHNILKVITTPDSAKGRGLKIVFPPVKNKALSLNLPVFQPDKFNSEDTLAELKKLNPDIGIVISFGRILRLPILKLPKYGCINIHGSLLPKYRGSAPIQWAIINNETRTGVTSMFMDEGIDTGDIIFQDEIPILPEDTSKTIHDKLSQLGGELLLKTLDAIESGNFPRAVQNNDFATHTRMIKKEDGEINWQKSSDEISGLVRGLIPWPGTYTFFNNKMLKIWDVSLCNDLTESNISPGQIIEIVKNQGIVISTGKGALLIKEVQPENKKRMAAYDFVLGHKLEKGLKFGK